MRLGPGLGMDNRQEMGLFFVLVHRFVRVGILDLMLDRLANRFEGLLHFSNVELSISLHSFVISLRISTPVSKNYLN